MVSSNTDPKEYRCAGATVIYWLYRNCQTNIDRVRQKGCLHKCYSKCSTKCSLSTPHYAFECWTEEILFKISNSLVFK